MQGDQEHFPPCSYHKAQHGNDIKSDVEMSCYPPGGTSTVLSSRFPPVLQQQHCLRNHWFKKLSPSDSRATQKYIHKMSAFKIGNPGYPGLGVPISCFALSHFVFAIKGNQETKGVYFVFPKLGATPLQRKPRNESTEGFEPTALSIPALLVDFSYTPKLNLSPY